MKPAKLILKERFASPTQEERREQLRRAVERYLTLALNNPRPPERPGEDPIHR